MKTRNQRELEKHWAKEAAKKIKLAKKAAPPGEAPKQASDTAKKANKPRPSR